MSDQRDDTQDRQQGFQSNALYAITQFLSRGAPDDPLMQDARRWVHALNPGAFFPDPAPTPTPLPSPVRMLLVLDVSSNNGMDITSLLDRYKPDAVVVKAYQSIELGGRGTAFTVAQARTARDRGLGVAFYPWLYAGIEGGRQVDDAMQGVKAAGGQGSALLLDCETYTDGSNPDRAVVLAAKAEARNVAPIVGGYTGLWWIDGYYPGGQAGWAQDMGDVWHWLSQYDGVRTLESTRLPAGVPFERLGGKQFTGSPVDLSIFRADALGLA